MASWSKQGGVSRSCGDEPELRDLEKAIAQSKARVMEIFEQLEQQAADEFHELRSAAG